jgi:hypothetical protein
LGLDTFDDELEDASHILVGRITADINNTINYVLVTSNVLATRITDEVGYTTNYVCTTSNVLATRIIDEVGYTINYVLATSNILVGRINDTSNVLSTRIDNTSNYADSLRLRINALEGTEGSPGDISLGVPAIPSTGAIAVTAAIATVTAACVVGEGVTALTLIDMFETKVDNNNNDSSNYVWSTSNILVGRMIVEDKYSSNYTES